MTVYKKEAAKREQEQPTARVSLNARLAEKKAQVAGKDHEPHKNIKIIRGRCNDMNTMFTVEENNLICVFASESRNEVIGDIERVLPYLNDPDMEELSYRVIGKLRNMTDEEFEQLELIEAG